MPGFEPPELNISLKHGFEVDEELLYAFGTIFNPPELNIIFKARIRGR